jgi:hypothetical protein
MVSLGFCVQNCSDVATGSSYLFSPPF